MIQQLSAPELKSMLESGAPFELIDVRNQWERDLACIAGSRLLDQAYHDHAIWRASRDRGCSTRPTTIIC